jgi:hypothetical protein
MTRALASWLASRFRPGPALAPTFTTAAHEAAGLISPAPAAITATAAASTATTAPIITGTRSAPDGPPSRMA